MNSTWPRVHKKADIPSSVNPWFIIMRPPPLVLTGTSAAATAVESDDASGDGGTVSRGFLWELRDGVLRLDMKVALSRLESAKCPLLSRLLDVL